MLPEARETYELEKLWTLGSYDDQLTQMTTQSLPEDFILGLTSQQRWEGSQSCDKNWRQLLRWRVAREMSALTDTRGSRLQCWLNHQRSWSAQNDAFIGCAWVNCWRSYQNVRKKEPYHKGVSWESHSLSGVWNRSLFPAPLQFTLKLGHCLCTDHFPSTFERPARSGSAREVSVLWEGRVLQGEPWDKQCSLDEVFIKPVASGHVEANHVLSWRRRENIMALLST